MALSDVIADSLGALFAMYYVDKEWFLLRFYKKM